MLVFAVIVANTASMASENMSAKTPRTDFADGFEKAYTALFAVEAVLKILDQGLLFSSDSYLASGWNQFDFLLVIGTVSSLFTTMGSQFMAMRAVRCFRPLRAMKNFRDGQLLMRTTLTALPLLRDALIFLCWFMLVASVSGTMAFAGKLTGRCVERSVQVYDSVTNTTVVQYTNETLTSGGSCPSKELVLDAGAICDRSGRGAACDSSIGEVCCPSTHLPYDGFLSFDNFYRSVIIVLNTITIDGWNELANDAADAAGFEFVFPYFACIVFFGGFYVMQLFQSVMIITLSHVSDVMDKQDRKEARDEARRSKGLSGGVSGDDFDDNNNPEKKKSGVDVDGIGTLINFIGTVVGRGYETVRLRMKGPKEGYASRKLEKENSLRNTPYVRFRLSVRKVVSHEYFQRFVLLTIMCNTVTMAANSYGQSDAYYKVLNTCELVFTSVFIAEFTLKHIALGFWKYWCNPWNVVDGVVVISGIVELAVGSGADGIATLRTLRVLRIFAGLKGLRKHRAFRQVFAAVVNGVRRIVSFCLVFFLFLTVFAILGMQLSGGVFDDDTEYEYTRLRFDTFGDAVLTLFIVCTGENTFTVGWDLAEASGTSWALFYVSSWSLVSTSLLALVLGVLIQATTEPVVLADDIDTDSDDDGEDEGDGKLKRKDSNKLKKKESNKGTLDVFRSNSTRNSLEAGDEHKSPSFQQESKSAEQDTIAEDNNTPAVDSSKHDEHAEAELAHARKNAEVEVAAVRLWLDEHGFTVRQREVLRLEVVDGEVARKVTRAGETADDVRGRFSEKQLVAARDRVTAARRSGVLVDRERHHGTDSDSEDEDDAGASSRGDNPFHNPTAWGLGGRAASVTEKPPDAIKFGMGTTSKVRGGAEMLKRKAERKFAKLRQERELREMDRRVLKKRQGEKRAAEVGIDPAKNKAWYVCLKIIEHPLCRNTILSLIIISACLLAPQCDKDWPAPGSSVEKTLAGIDYFFTAAFTLEMGLKIFAYTFYSGPCGYAKDGWNVLDSFIVCMSLLTVALSSLATSSGVGGNLKVFRVLRVLRPLRVIKNIPSLKLVIDATLVSLPSILTVCALGIVTFIILGVLGMALFRGAFRVCSVSNDGGDKESCVAAGGEFINSPLHFDNIGQAIVAVFVMSTGDNWQDIMYLGIDSRGENLEPQFERNKNLAFFFVVVVVVAFFFWANLFVSSLVDNFSQVASEMGGDSDEASASEFSSSGYQYSESQRRWLLALKAGVRASTEEWRDANPLAMLFARRVVFKIRASKFWEPFVTVFITANAIQLCFYRADASDSEVELMTTLSVVFAVLYVLETVINVTAMTWAQYWASGWHRLDFTVTVVGLFELLLLFILGENGSGFVTVFRTVRFFRLFKLLKTSPGLRSLVDTFLTALPGMLNILGLMFLMMHIYACLGCTLYGDIPEPYPGDGLTAYWNFHNWGNAMSLLFVSLSGNWAEIFKDAYYVCGTGPDSLSPTAVACDTYRLSAVFYFFSFVIFAVYLLANLFVAILIERFDYCSTMEGVYDKQDPFDALVRLNVLRKFGTKIRNRLRMVRTFQKVEQRRSIDAIEHDKTPNDPAADLHKQTTFRTANARLREIVNGPRLKAYRTLKNNLAVAMRGFGSMPEGHANFLVERALDLDAKHRAEEAEAAEKQKSSMEPLPEVYASAGGEVVVNDGSDSDDDGKTKSVFGFGLRALNAFTFSPAKKQYQKNR